MYKSFKVAIEFDVSVYTELEDTSADIQHLHQALEHVISYWTDGRYNFSTEMMQEGLSRALTKAFGDAVERPFRDRHGNKIIANKLVATYLADKKLEGLSVNAHQAPCLLSVREKDDNE